MKNIFNEILQKESLGPFIPSIDEPFWQCLTKLGRHKLIARKGLQASFLKPKNYCKPIIGYCVMCEKPLYDKYPLCAECYFGQRGAYNHQTIIRGGKYYH